MNGFSQKKLRRLPALILFLTLGPALLLAVLGLVVYRHSGGSRLDEEERLSRLFRVRTEMRDAEFVRPGIRTYFGLTLFAGRAETPFLFCPEILARPLGPDRLSQTQTVRLLGEMQIEESPLTRPTDADGTKEPAGREWLIPDLYLKLSQWRDAEPFLHGRGTDFPAGGIVFRIGRVHLIPSDELFDQIAEEYRRPRRRFGADIIEELAAIGGEKTRGRHGGVSPSDEVRLYTQNETESLIDEVLGIWLRAEDDSFILARFRFPEITATEPITLALFGRSGVRSAPDETVTQETAAGTAPDSPADPLPQSTPTAVNRGFPLRWLLDSSSSAFPARVLAWFAPAFAGWGEGCWLSGRLVSFPEPNGDEPSRRRTVLSGVEIHDARLSTLLGKITSTRIEGTLNRLTIREGVLSGGVFFGDGRIRLLDARFKKDFLIRFQERFGLEFQPGNILVNRFENDMVPFDQVMFDFALRQEGVLIKAADGSRDGTAAVSQSTEPGYKAILPTSGEKTVPYPDLLETVSDGNENSFWSSFYRNALNHLPVPDEKPQ